MSNGGGINTYLGSMTITNSTFSGNAAAYGGGIASPFPTSGAAVSVTHSTIAGNTATYGGGLYKSNASSIQLGSTIVSENTSANGADLSGVFTSLGYNVIGTTVGATISGVQTGNLTNAAASPLNLGALANNGGLTQTMALSAGSVAINAGDPAFAPPPDSDQRGTGFPRVVAGVIDIGAFESNMSGPPVVEVTIQLQGHPAAPNPASIMQLYVVVTLQGGGSAVFDQVVTTDPYGHFSLNGVAPGAYHLWIKGEHTLAAAQDVTLVAGTNIITMDTLREGDADNNNLVNLTDFSLLATTFGKQSIDPGYDERADFNDSGVVNLLDFSLLAANFGQVGGDG